jgi:hypothetical protein
MKKINNTKKLFLWTFLWLVSFAVLVNAPGELWENQIISIIAAIINFILIITMLYSNKNVFDEYDEFQKKIQLEAIAISLFLNIFIGLLWVGVYQSGLINSQPKIHLLVVFTCLTYVISAAVISKKYK